MTAEGGATATAATLCDATPHRLEGRCAKRNSVLSVCTHLSRVPSIVVTHKLRDGLRRVHRYHRGVRRVVRFNSRRVVRRVAWRWRRGWCFNIREVRPCARSEHVAAEISRNCLRRPALPRRPCRSETASSNCTVRAEQLLEIERLAAGVDRREVAKVCRRLHRWRTPPAVCCSESSEMTGNGVRGSASVVLAAGMPATLRANSHTSICMPRQSPR